MISRYSDHAANERTFLAWVRTGIATIAFGFVIERFNLLIAAMEPSDKIASHGKRLLGTAANAVSSYDGAALIFLGIALIALAAVRFVRTGKLIDAEETHGMQSARSELVLSLALILAALGAYIALV